MSIAALERAELKEKVVKGPEIQERLHESLVVKAFLESLIGCDYAGFFRALGTSPNFLFSLCPSFLTPLGNIFIWCLDVFACENWLRLLTLWELTLSSLRLQWRLRTR